MDGWLLPRRTNGAEKWQMGEREWGVGAGVVRLQPSFCVGGLGEGRRVDHFIGIEYPN